jgi:hypothetical protein
MSQFILFKSSENLENYNYIIRLIECAENKQFLSDIANKFFGNDEMNDIWFVKDFDNLFKLAQRQYGVVPFEETEIYLQLSTLYDISEVIILWYSDFCQDLDIVNTKEQFLQEVQKGIYCPSGMCECYLHVIRYPE